MEKMTVDANIDLLDDVLEKFEGMMGDRERSPKFDMQMHIAIEELFVNIASYAYPEGTTGKADIIMDIDSDDTVVITFIDEGTPYDPLAKEDPDITLSAQERGIGGLGIFMVKKSMDDMSYKYEDNKNKLTIKKKIF